MLARAPARFNHSTRYASHTTRTSQSEHCALHGFRPETPERPLGLESPRRASTLLRVTCCPVRRLCSFCARSSVGCLSAFLCVWLAGCLLLLSAAAARSICSRTRKFATEEKISSGGGHEQRVAAGGSKAGEASKKKNRVFPPSTLGECMRSLCAPRSPVFPLCAHDPGEFDVHHALDADFSYKRKTKAPKNGGIFGDLR